VNGEMNVQDAMSKSASLGSLSQAARPPRPPSAGSSRLGAATVDVTNFREWTVTGGRRSALEGARNRPMSASLAGQAASSRAFSKESQRPQSAGSQSNGWLPSMPKPEGSREQLLPPPPGRFGGLAPPLPPLPNAQDIDRETSGSKAAGVASEPLPGVESRKSQAAATATGDGSTVEDPDSSADFTEEELRLEREVEQALNELEAVESAMAAMRLRLENAVDDERTSSKELAELRAGIEQWQKTAEAGLRELGHRQEQLDAALAASTAEEEQAAASKVAGEKRLDMAAEKVKVLETQTSRLSDQVAESEVSLKLKMEEHRRVQQQVAAIEEELKVMRQEQRDMRSSTKALENEIKEHEAVLSSSLRKRQVLERQVVQFKGEASGLHARVASLPVTSRPSTAAASVQAVDAVATSGQKSSDQTLLEGCLPAPVPSIQDVQVLPGETARDVSLRLQREVVDLWAALRHCKCEAGSGMESPHAALPVHALPAAAA